MNARSDSNIDNSEDGDSRKRIGHDKEDDGKSSSRIPKEKSAR
jgi:hypothetical protein